MAAVLAHMNTSGLSASGLGLENAPRSPNLQCDDESREDQAEDEEFGLATPESSVSAPLRPPPGSESTTFNERSQMNENYSIDFFN